MNIFQELEEQKKEKNVVVFGLEHEGKPKKALIKLCKDALNLDVSDSIQRATNGKNPNLIFASFKRQEDKDRLLQLARNLRKSASIEYRQVFINQDLTPLQRDRLKQLRTELKERRQSGEKVSIRGWSIVTDSTRAHMD